MDVKGTNDALVGNIFCSGTRREGDVFTTGRLHSKDSVIGFNLRGVISLYCCTISASLLSLNLLTAPFCSTFLVDSLCFNVLSIQSTIA